MICRDSDPVHDRDDLFKRGFRHEGRYQSIDVQAEFALSDPGFAHSPDGTL